MGRDVPLWLAAFGLSIAAASYLYARTSDLTALRRRESDPALSRNGSAMSDSARRRAAKLFNERLKLMATFFNGIGVASLVAAIVTPYLNGESRLLTWSTAVIGLFFAVVLHLLGQFVLTYWKSEE